MRVFLLSFISIGKEIKETRYHSIFHKTSIVDVSPSAPWMIHKLPCIIIGAGKWALSFRYDNKNSLDLQDWYIKGVSGYVSELGGAVSYLGAFVDSAEMKNNVISLEINELHFRQYGD